MPAVERRLTRPYTNNVFAPSRRDWLRTLAALALVAPRAARAEDVPSWVQWRPLPNDAERKRLTAEYLAAHLPEGLVSSTTMTPQAIVLHWTGSGSAQGTWNTFAPARLGGRPELQGAGALNVGAHFIVDRDGSTLQLAPTDQVLRHVIGLNHCAVGVENVGDGPPRGSTDAPLTDAQIDRNAQLVRWLVQKHPSIRYLLGHHEYRRMEKTPLFAERDSSYRTGKSDPGALFMDAVRAQTVDLGLLAPP